MPVANIQNLKISDIASLITGDWVNPSPHAVPYLEAMFAIDSISDQYYADSALSVVSYYLCNCAGHKGEVARETKAELKRRVKLREKELSTR